MTWLMWIFEYIEKFALLIANLDFLYIEWVLDLIFPFYLFIVCLFAVPIFMIVSMFGLCFYELRITREMLFFIKKFSFFFINIYSNIVIFLFKKASL